MCVRIKAVSKALFYSARLVTGRENIGIFWANFDRNATRENKSKIFGKLFRPERAREGIIGNPKMNPSINDFLVCDFTTTFFIPHYLKNKTQILDNYDNIISTNKYIFCAK